MKSPQKVLDIQFDFSLLQHIDPYKMQSWADVIIWCAAAGIEPNIDMYKFFLLGAFFSRNVNKMLMHTIKETNFLDDLANTVEGAEAAYVIADRASSVGASIRYYNSQDRYDYKFFWEKYLYENGIENQPIDDSYELNEYSPAAQIEIVSNIKYKLWSALDLRFPLLWLKLFSKWSSTIRIADETFVQFLVTRTQLKAKHSKQFEKLYAQLLAECSKARNIQMHLR